MSCRDSANEAADSTVPDDAMISSVHFLLQCEPDQCKVQDLNSVNGTWLNGEKVSEAILTDGDTILAGSTSFVVHLVKEQPRTGPRLEDTSQRTKMCLLKTAKRDGAVE